MTTPTPVDPPAPAEPPSPAAPPTATPIPPAPSSDDEDRRLGILRDLERGDIDVAEAGLRLEALDVDADAAAVERDDA